MDAETAAKVVAYATASLAALTVSPLILYSLNSYLCRRFSKKITSQAELDRMVAEEAEKLGIEAPIKAVLQEGFAGGHVSRTPDGYLIEMGRRAATMMVVRHEFGHIRQGNVGHGPNVPFLDFFYAFYWAELRATAYQYGIKL